MNSEASIIQESDKGFVRSFVFMRWMLVILGSYLVLIPYRKSNWFVEVVVFIMAFAMSNVVLMFIPAKYYRLSRYQNGVLLADLVFGCAMFVLIGIRDNYVFIPFMLIYLLAAVRRDLKSVAFSMIAVSIFFGVFSLLRIDGEYYVGLGLIKPVDIFGGTLEQFLTLALFFIAAVFYLFLSDHVRKDAYTAGMLRTEKRRSEIMGEITRSLLSSLNSQAILFLIVTRLAEVFEAVCSIVQLDDEGRVGKFLVTSNQPELAGTAIDLDAYPEIPKANGLRNLLFVPEVQRNGVVQSAVVMPMVAHESVLGILHLQHNGKEVSLSESDERFIRMMSATTANALYNAHLFEEMEHKAKTDFMTGLYNHRTFQAILTTELNRARRHSQVLSLMIVDLDFLKQVNDRFGHVVGDAVIREVGETIRANCRNFDVVARYGGEEYVVILPETTRIEAVLVAERIRERISENNYTGVGHVTASLGVSTYPSDALGKEELIRAADRALYMSKNNGRNRVSYFDPEVALKEA